MTKLDQQIYSFDVIDLRALLRIILDKKMVISITGSQETRVRNFHGDFRRRK